MLLQPRHPKKHTWKKVRIIVIIVTPKFFLCHHHTTMPFSSKLIRCILKRQKELTKPAKRAGQAGLDMIFAIKIGSLLKQILFSPLFDSQSQAYYLTWITIKKSMPLDFVEPRMKREFWSDLVAFHLLYQTSHPFLLKWRVSILYIQFTIKWRCTCKLYLTWCTHTYTNVWWLSNLLSPMWSL